LEFGQVRTAEEVQAGSRTNSEETVQRMIPGVVEIPFGVTEVSAEARAGAARVLESGWLTSGPEVLEFEREFASWVQVEHAVAVSSCTAAIELALRGLRLPPGAKVLTTTMTFCGAAHAIVHAGLQPVLADIDPETLMPTPATIAAAVRRAGGADAMLALHYGGAPVPVEEHAEAAALQLSQVVEDAAHALGTWAGDRPVGSISRATCFSFYATKNLPIGEGGMLTTADPELASDVRQNRLHGMDHDAWRRYQPNGSWHYDVRTVGLKANMTDLQAAIGRGQLAHVETWQHRRAELAGLYDELLARVAGVRRPAWPRQGRHAWHLYVVQVEPPASRDRVIARLAGRGVHCSVHFIPLHRHECYRELLDGPAAAEYPGAEAAFDSILSLPLYPSLSEREVEIVVHELADAVHGG
jgi:dTDP-4-amino-4,6-dideoxygalactose transaminase